MKPVKLYDTDLDRIRDKINRLNLEPETVKEAIKWARSK